MTKQAVSAVEQVMPRRIQATVVAITIATTFLIGVASTAAWLPPFSVDTVVLAGVLVALIVLADFLDIDLPH
ncbi:MAG: hypothetical protein IRY97_02040, partial [Thermomicrobiaceae bacterium]|nr:hypothetical protein [Thermomicrobiaceae bacterium]